MDKNIKKVIEKDKNGEDIVKEVSNPQGISMSYMQYLIECMENEQYGKLITQQVISMFELVFHIKNGLYCPKCGKIIEQSNLMQDFAEYQKKLKGLDETSQKIKSLEFLKKYQTCSECQETMRDIFNIKKGTIKKLCIRDFEFSPRDFDEFIAIVTHQNILDYEGDKYIDPNLKKDMELKNRLQNKNYSSPSLEKQMVCVSISSPYTIEQIKESLTLRKLSQMLKTIDAKNYYFAQVQGQMSGMVTFKTEPVHWIFGDNKKDMSKEIMTLNDVQSKFAQVT